MINIMIKNPSKRYKLCMCMRGEAKALLTYPSTPPPTCPDTNCRGNEE